MKLGNIFNFMTMNSEKSPEEARKKYLEGDEVEFAFIPRYEIVFCIVDNRNAERVVYKSKDQSKVLSFYNRIK